MSSVKEYFSEIGEGFSSLLKGMSVTGRELFTKKVTEEYESNETTRALIETIKKKINPN